MMRRELQYETVPTNCREIFDTDQEIGSWSQLAASGEAIKLDCLSSRIECRLNLRVGARARVSP